MLYIILYHNHPRIPTLQEDIYVILTILTEDCEDCEDCHGLPRNFRFSMEKKLMM